MQKNLITPKSKLFSKYLVIYVSDGPNSFSYLQFNTRRYFSFRQRERNPYSMSCATIFADFLYEAIYLAGTILSKF